MVAQPANILPIAPTSSMGAGYNLSCSSSTSAPCLYGRAAKGGSGSEASSPMWET